MENGERKTEDDRRKNGGWKTPAETEGEDDGEELRGGHPRHGTDRQLDVRLHVALQLVVAALEGGGAGVLKR